MVGSLLTLPELPSRYAEALSECAKAAFDRYDVLAILASGTIIRGVPDPRSDLDVYVLHRGAFRERRQEWHRGVPCEVFVNPLSQMRKYFEQERTEGQPMTAHMFATGRAIYDPDHVLPELQKVAEDLLSNPPSLPPAQAIVQARYSAATMFEDALDFVERDPVNGAMMLGMAVWELMKCRIGVEPGWFPRAKDLPMRLREIDPEAADLAMAATTSSCLPERIEAARRLCIRVTGSEGFFEWVSEREAL